MYARLWKFCSTLRALITDPFADSRSPPLHTMTGSVHHRFECDFKGAGLRAAWVVKSERQAGGGEQTSKNVPFGKENIPTMLAYIFLMDEPYLLGKVN